jgi:flagellar basal-body rod modification protein FlgD
MATVDSILSELGSASRSASSAASTASSALGKDDFLELLVVQLQNQDPLNPLDDKEFIAQLAQFSSLEQMSNVASGIEALTETVSRQDSLSAVSYIGKNVVAEGNTVSKLDSGITPVYFTLNDTAATVSINVYDQNNNIVQTETLNSMQAGEYTFSWDGLDYNGKTADNGQYKVYFAAVDANDRAVLVDTKVVGTITGVSKTSDEIAFRLSDGRTVQFDDISMVTQGVSAE